VGVWQWDFEAGQFSIDAPWCQAVRVDPCAGPDHLVRWVRQIHPDDVAEFQRKCEGIRVGRLERFEVEYRMLASDSRWIWVLHRGSTVDRVRNGHALRAHGICIEIDDRKRAEVALQENEARLATALWGARAAFWQWHLTTDVTAMSPLWFAMTGYTREQWESIPNPWLSRLHPDDRPDVERVIRDHLAGRTPSIEVEYRIRAASGDWKWMLTRGRAVEWDFEGNATSAIGVSLDIDAQKRAERELRTTEVRLETAAWASGVGLWELDFRTDHLRWFSDWCDRLDLYACEGRDHLTRWHSYVYPDDLPEAQHRFEEHLAGRTDHYEAEYRIRNRKGLWKWLFERGRVVERTANGAAVRMVGVRIDISARKHGEIEAIRNQHRLLVALESARGDMWDWDLLTGQARHTDFYYRMLGVGADEGPHDTPLWETRIHPEDLQRARDCLREVIQLRRELYEAEYRLRHADGTWRWVLDRGRLAEHDASGHPTRMVGFLVDITDRVQTQEALRQSEFRYRTVASMAPGFIFEYRYNAAGRLEAAWASEGMQAVLGCTLEETEQRSGWETLVDEEFKPMARVRQARVAQGETQSGEVRVQAANGEKKWLQISIQPVRDPRTETVVGMIGSAHDITTRKLAEQAVRESEAVLRAVTENTPDWLFLIDEQLRVRFTNRHFGAHRVEELLGCSLLQFIPQAHRASLEELYRGVLKTGEPARFEIRYQNADGTLSHFEHRVMPVVESGVVRSLTVAVTDVTDRKRAEAALRESQMTLQTVAASSADWLGLFDRQRRCVFLNRAFNNIPPENWIGAPVEDFSPPADRAYVHEIFEHIMRTGEARDFDQVIFDPQRGPRYFELRARPVQADGRVFGTVVNITEVTERHAQQDVMRTQARILQTMREGVVLVDSASYAIKLTNPAFDRMFRYGPQELLGRPVQPLFVLPAEHRKRLERTLHDSPDSTELIPQEFDCIRKDGTRFLATCVVTPLSMGGAEHWLAVLNDVTERKRLEHEIIQISNREQQRIGNDLHDGLGQDLTGIALMLRGIVAQLRKEGSPTSLDVEDVIGLVNNAIDSTRSLAKGLSPVTGERGGLAAAIQSMAGRASERYGVRVEFHAEFKEPLRLTENPATHVYRIVQEAITNVVRHSRATEVRVRMETYGGELHVSIEDNGRGFAQAPSDDEDGLGLKIMRYRAQMMGGELVIQSSAAGGAVVRCTCPLSTNSTEMTPAVPPDTP
jgi:PAS domain S-box-containing protein